MFKQALAIATLSFASQAMAGPLYSYTDNNAVNGGPTGDVIDSLSTTWDADNEIFTWETTFTDSEIDSFWLVVNNKDNPKQVDTNELVIMYGDLTAEKVYTYVYNGMNNANSYQTSDLLQTDTLTVVDNSISFTIDATDINNANIAAGSQQADPYQGLVFGPDSIGIWFHVAKGTTLTQVDGSIVDYSFQSQGWYDGKDFALTSTSTSAPQVGTFGVNSLGQPGTFGVASVPEPGSIALIGLGILGLGLTRRRRAAK